MRGRVKYLLVIAIAIVISPMAASARGWHDLWNGKDLVGWEIVGGGSWTATGDGILVGQGDAQNPFRGQSWLYTKREFTEYDLAFEYWLRLGGNSGISIGDRSRARFAVPGPAANGQRTPARVAYEINIDNGKPAGYDISGSIYLLVKATPGLQRPNDWNRMRIEVRKDAIRVRVNGKLAAEHPGLPERPKAGPIGLQLHDARDVVMFRRIRIREISR